MMRFPMQRVARAPSTLTVWLLAILSVGVFFPEDAVAGSEMKRSAGPMSRSAGSRRSGTLGSERRGRSSAVSGSSARSAPDSSSDDWDTGSESGNDDDAAESSMAEDESDSTEAESEIVEDAGDDEEEAADYGSRTLGRACIYGVRGEVVFRPRGRRCRGDHAKPRPHGEDSRGRRAVKSDATQGVPAARRPEAPRNEARARKVSEVRSPARARGRCIRGAGDRIIYAPPGVDCRR